MSNTPKTDILRERIPDLVAVEILNSHEELERELATMTAAKNKALEALKECVSDRNSFCITSESVEGGQRRLSEINRIALKAIAELEKLN